MKRLLIALLLTGTAFAQQPASPEAAALAKMRDAMRGLTKRITDAETNAATAQAAQLAAEAKVKELEGTIASLTKELKAETELRKAEKESAEKADTALKAKLTNKENEAKALAESLTKWKAGFEQARDVANAKEGERAEAVNKAIAAQRQSEEHIRKNREMYKLGLEILERYKSFGFGTALLSREPFVGSMRVKFQNYVNDYGDKLATQRISAGKVEESPKKP